MEYVTLDLDRATYRRIVADLDADGYIHDAPSAEAARIDGGICADLACRDCRQPLRYAPWTNRKRMFGEGRYRAFVVCPQCGKASEF